MITIALRGLKWLPRPSKTRHFLPYSVRTSLCEGEIGEEGAIGRERGMGLR